jgi:hypothetical protein
VTREELAALIAEHEADYDADCSYHSGCGCGWPGEEFADTRDMAEGRRTWAAHLAEVITKARP